MKCDFVKRLARDEHGGPAMEYGFLIAFIALGIVGLQSGIAQAVVNIYDTSDRSMDEVIAAMPSASTPSSTSLSGQEGDSDGSSSQSSHRHRRGCH